MICIRASLSAFTLHTYYPAVWELFVSVCWTNSAALNHSVTETPFWRSRCFWHLTLSIFIWPPAELCYLFEYRRVRNIYLFAALERNSACWVTQEKTLCPTVLRFDTRKELIFLLRLLKGARCFGSELKEKKPQRWSTVKPVKAENTLTMNLWTFDMIPMWAWWSNRVDQPNHSSKIF